MTSNQDDEVPAWIWGMIGVGVITVLVILSFVFRTAALAENKTFLVPEQNVKTDAFNHTNAFLNGTKRDMEEAVYAYEMSKDDGEKAVILNRLRNLVNEAPSDFPIPADVTRLLNQKALP
jgi:hypothetical protein